MAFDSNGALWVSDATIAMGMPTIYSNGHLYRFDTSTLASIPQGGASADATYNVDPSLGGYAALGTGPTGYIVGGTVASMGMSGITGNSVRKISITDGTAVSLAGVGGPDGYVAPPMVSDFAVDANGNLVVGFMNSGQSGSYLAAYLIPVTNQPPGGRCTGALISGSTWGCTITGLYSNLLYAITVTATVSYGTWTPMYSQFGYPTYSQTTATVPSSASTIATAYATAPNVPPPAVTGVTASQVQTGVSVSWTPGSDPTKPNASSYTASAYLGTSTTPAGSCDISSPATTCVITGLAAGTYSIKVAAKNNYTSTHTSSIPVTAASSTITVTTPPGAPTGVSATPGAASATVSWTAPTNLGGASAGSITYAVTAVPTGQGSAGTCTWTTGTTATCTGLSTSTSYNFSVVASNPAGAGQAGTTATAITPLAPPGTPNAPTVSVGDGGFVVKGSSTQTTGIASPGAQTLTYTATAYDPQSQAAGACVYSDATTGCAITGLTNGVSYTVRVVATNSAGISSTASNATTKVPAGAPTAPNTLAATSGDASLSFTWAAPTSSGGDGVAITGYVITATPSGGTCSVTTSDPTASTQAGTCTGLTNGTSYTISISAQNGSGDTLQAGPQASVVAVPAAAPGAPTGVVVTAGDQSLNVSWTAVTATNGAAITGYTASAFTGSDITPVSSCTTTGATACSIFGLANGTSYNVKVTATNSAGTSAASSAVAKAPVAAPSSAPAAPTNLNATHTTGSSNTKITLTFTGSASVTIGSGSAAKVLPVTGYVVTSSPAGATCTTTSAVTASSQTWTCVGTAGTSYSFKVAASNKLATGAVTQKIGTTTYSFGQGSYSASSSSVSIEGVATAPQNLVIVAKNGNITAKWTAPANTGGADITQYKVTATDPAGVAATANCTATGVVGCTISGLSTVAAYTVSVVATNSHGDSPAVSATGIVPALGFTSLAPTALFQIAVGANGVITRSLNGGTTWNATPDSTPTLEDLNAVACIPGSFCVVVGTNGTILEWKYSYASGSVTKTPTLAAGVVTVNATNNLVVGQQVWLSSSPSAVFTVASATSSSFTIKNATIPTGWAKNATLNWVSATGQTWTQVSSGTQSDLFGIGCYSATGCIATGSNGAIVSLKTASSSDATLTATTVTQTVFADGDTVRSLACPNTSCILVGDNGKMGVLSTSGQSPTVAALAVTGLGTTNLLSARCVSASYCLVVGAGGAIFTTKPSSTNPTVASNWQKLTLTSAQTTSDLKGIACPTTNVCLAVGAAGAVETSVTTGAVLAGSLTSGAGAWAKVASGLSYDLSGIRCSSATSCVAAGVGHLVLVTRATATATTWTVRQIG